MKLKILYRSSIVWNLVLFSLLSISFVYLQYVSSVTSTVFNFSNSVLFINNYTYYVGVSLVTIILLLTSYSKLSGYLFCLSSMFTATITINNLYTDFSKISLILLFFHLVFTYYFYLFYYIDISESYYTPRFKRNNLFSPMLKKIPIEVWDKEKDERIVSGYLTNWSLEGCFIFSDKQVLVKRKYCIKIKFLGAEFCENATLASSSSEFTGHGFRFTNRQSKIVNNSKVLHQNNLLDWKNFYEIINEMGYTPELLK